MIELLFVLIATMLIVFVAVKLLKKFIVNLHKEVQDEVDRQIQSRVLDARIAAHDRWTQKLDAGEYDGYSYGALQREAYVELTTALEAL